MKQSRGAGAGRFHHGFLAIAPGGAIGFIGSVSGKGCVMLAQKWRLTGGAKMRNARGDAEIGGIEKRGDHGIKLSSDWRIIGILARFWHDSEQGERHARLPQDGRGIQGLNGRGVKTGVDPFRKTGPKAFSAFFMPSFRGINLWSSIQGIRPCR
jgi:hypothetical protein